MGMNKFALDELTRLGETQESSMQDVCQIGSYVPPYEDDYGNSVKRYLYSAEMFCGFRHISPREAQATTFVPMVDGEIRLPLDTEVKASDRIKILERYGRRLTVAEVYEITGPVQRGPSGFVVGLVVVTDGSD